MMKFFICFLLLVESSVSLLQAQTCPNNLIINGGFELGTPSQSDEDINNATGYSPIWNGGSSAEFYTSNYAPAPLPPAPADGNYASCWIANYNYPHIGYREGFMGSFSATIPSNSGSYNLSMEVACLSGWGQSEIAVYGVYNPNQTIAPTPTGHFSPSNLQLFPSGNTVLLGTIPIDLSTRDHNKVTEVFSFNSNNFPVGGITHFFITHSDAAVNGAIYTAFDNLCIAPDNTPPPTPCPSLDSVTAVCLGDIDGDGVADYELTLAIQGFSGSIDFAAPCGTFSPDGFFINGSSTYTTILTGRANCALYSTGFIYQLYNGEEQECDNDRIRIDLPPCTIPAPCPDISNVSAACIGDVDGDGYNDHEITLTVSNPNGSLDLQASCGTISPAVVTLNGATTYTVTLTGGHNCTNNGLGIIYNANSTNTPNCASGRRQLTLPDCPVDNTCPCDGAFTQAVQQGFFYLEDCDYDTYRPALLLNECDQVIWYFNGHVVGTSTGYQDFTYLHTNVSATVCMEVTRTRPNGQTCQEQHCTTINPSIWCPGTNHPFEAFPNPTSNTVELSWSTEEIAPELELALYNSSGILVLQKVAINGYDGRIKLDMSTLPAGLYWATLIGENYSPAPIKIIKE